MSGLSLPEDVVQWIEASSGRPLQAADRIPGGGTRQGWFIDLGPADDPLELFLRYSSAPLPEPTAFHRLATEADVLAALHRVGVPVPAVHAVHPSREAVLMDRIAGATWFSRIKDPDEQVRVARDFIQTLASIHRLDPRKLEVAALGPARSAREHALERITEIRRRATAADGSMDPLVRVSADWLERNVPDYDGPVVLVQGDTGPGNFLYQDGRVTAVLDWELCHWGDPMDDIAWLSLRTVQDTFTHLPDRLAEYVEASGHALDVRRVWYYRVFAETTMRTLYPPERDAVVVDGTQPAEADVGNQILYTQLHRRLWLEALDAVMGMNLPRPEPVEPVEPPPWHDRYGDALSMLLTITPRISDPLASQWAKGVARLVRYLRDADAVGRKYLDLESAEIEQLLGFRPSSLAAARHALEAANRAGSVSDEEFISYLWNRTMREDLLMRNASGALGRRTWPPLVDGSPGDETATVVADAVGKGDSR